MLFGSVYVISCRNINVKLKNIKVSGDLRTFPLQELVSGVRNRRFCFCCRINSFMFPLLWQTRTNSSYWTDVWFYEGNIILKVGTCKRHFSAPKTSAEFLRGSVKRFPIFSAVFKNLFTVILQIFLVLLNYR